MRSVYRAVLTAAAAMLLLAVGAIGPATASSRTPLTTISCGQTITQSIRVANDLACSYPILTISGSGVTVDLNGHRLAGTTANSSCAAAHFPLFDCDIYVGDGSILTHGRLENAGVSLVGGQVNDVKVIGGHFIMRGGTLSRAGLHDSMLTGSGVDFWYRVDIAHNQFRGSGVSLWNGDYAGSGFSVADNVFRDSTVLSTPHGQAGSIVIDTSSAFFSQDVSGEIVRNDIRGSGGDGIWVYGRDVLGPLLIADNNVVGNDGDGVYATGTVVRPSIPPGAVPPAGPVTLQGNRATSNAGHGIVFEGTVAFVDAGGNLAHSNALDPQCIGVVCQRR